jgi:hypothetical protein
MQRYRVWLGPRLPDIEARLRQGEKLIEVR